MEHNDDAQEISTEKLVGWSGL